MELTKAEIILCGYNYVTIKEFILILKIDITRTGIEYWMAKNYIDWFRPGSFERFVVMTDKTKNKIKACKK